MAVTRDNDSAEPVIPDTNPPTHPAGKVQCPNCCRLAPVVSRRMGLLFFECELCGSVGATPDPEAP
jgi:hypothetical protein